nr:protein SET DOMAIN GROUP 41 isoform X2 [Erigeron canadensis]XP_043616502.1 protein SET DOMAIN GROUP 41 isoform X2 [Erigeron canadensis]
MARRKECVDDADDDGNMEIVGAADIRGAGQDLTPPLSPLSYSLHHAFLASHCSSCFSSLPPHPHHPFPHLYYCSSRCSSFHYPLYLSSASQHLSSPVSSDLSLALLLLHQINSSSSFSNYHRVCGLLTNRHKLLLLHHDDLSTRIQNGAREMAAAISLRDHCTLDSSKDYLLEEAVLCLVITNAVEVQDRIGQSVGIALYNIPFSWINHSCSPNACYRFLPPNHTAGVQQCLIMPASSSDAVKGRLEEICGGPRLVVRSIKAIKKGEQVTIAYTDLLQPKDSRQSELWSKYRFACGCHRCVAVPLTFVDLRLQESFVSNGRMLECVGLEKVTEYIDDAIDDYLSSSDAESCCKKLEDVLLNGFHYEQVIIRLHPQNRLSLNAYTTLASAYKVHAIAMEDDDDDDDDDDALKMIRFSSAYSFLLALSTHILFLNESSLITSVSNYWIGAGDSLLNLAASLVVSLDIPKSCSKCCSKCGLIDMFEAKSLDPDKVVEISREFLDCISDVTPKVWNFLVHGNGFLETVKDPSNLGWFETINSVANNKGNVKALMKDQERVELFWLGFHCLLYGGILSNISSGHNSYLSHSVQHLLYDR